VFNANNVWPVAGICVAIQNASVCSTYLLVWRVDFWVTERFTGMNTNYYSERMWEKKIVAFLTVLPQYLPCETKQKGTMHIWPYSYLTHSNWTAFWKWNLKNSTCSSIILWLLAGIKPVLRRTGWSYRFLDRPVTLHMSQKNWNRSYTAVKTWQLICARIILNSVVVVWLMYSTKYVVIWRGRESSCELKQPHLFTYV
jgi:hypothetical protein